MLGTARIFNNLNEGGTKLVPLTEGHGYVAKRMHVYVPEFQRPHGGPVKFRVLQSGRTPVYPKTPFLNGFWRASLRERKKPSSAMGGRRKQGSAENISALEQVNGNSRKREDPLQMSGAIARDPSNAPLPIKIPLQRTCHSNQCTTGSLGRALSRNSLMTSSVRDLSRKLFAGQDLGRCSVQERKQSQVRSVQKSVFGKRGSSASFTDLPSKGGETYWYQDKRDEEKGHNRGSKGRNLEETRLEESENEIKPLLNTETKRETKLTSPIKTQVEVTKKAQDCSNLLTRKNTKKNKVNKKEEESFKELGEEEKGKGSKYTSSIKEHPTISVLLWLTENAEALLSHHEPSAQSLSESKKQKSDFLAFYNITSKHLEQGNKLLENVLGDQKQDEISATENDASDFAQALQLQLANFTEKLTLTKDRLDETAKCYEMLDKAYEWALDAMKVIEKVKSEGLASPDQVGIAAKLIGQHLEEHPPLDESFFSAMNDMAARLSNQVLQQQCKMAQTRCDETCDLLKSRQAALQKAKRQMEFDCQSFVDLNDILGGVEEPSPFSWLANFNNSGRRRCSLSSVSSKAHDPLSRCSSFETDDESVFGEPTKAALEGRPSLRGIKEVRESAEDLQTDIASHLIATKGLSYASHSIPPIDGVSSSSSSSSASCSSSRDYSSPCDSSETSGPTTANKVMKLAEWQFTSGGSRCGDTDDGEMSPSCPIKSLPSSSVNSHLLIRGSQLNLTNSSDLTTEEVKKSKRLLFNLRELIQTERDYVSSLEYIIENYIPELMREDIPQALRGQRNVIFGNIEKIFEFHSIYFLRALESCESRPFAVGSLFLKYESQFYLYALYNKNKPKSDQLMSEYGSSFFKNKQVELNDRMDLASYLLKPFQRMGKYALILKQLLKECGKDEEGFEDLKAAEEMVQFQLRHGNDLLAMDSLRDCDVNLKEQGRLLRQNEFVVWEGGRMKRTVRHVFLFEDLILFSKARKDPDKKTLDIFQYKYSMKMTDIGLTEQMGTSPSKFEIWFRKRKPSDTYILQASATDVKESWTEELSKLLWRQALRNRTMRLHEMSSMGIGNKPCLDIRPSEDQINDRSVNINQCNKMPSGLRRNSLSGINEALLSPRRPHSILSVTSSSSSSSSSSNASYTQQLSHSSMFVSHHINSEAKDSPRPLHRSVTRTSHCSAESGILADISQIDHEDSLSLRRIERSNSTLTTVSVDSALSYSTSVSPTIVPVSSSPTSISKSYPLCLELPVKERLNNRLYDSSCKSPSKTLLTTEV